MPYSVGRDFSNVGDRRRLGHRRGDYGSVIRHKRESRFSIVKKFVINVNNNICDKLNTLQTTLKDRIVERLYNDEAEQKECLDGRRRKGNGRSPVVTILEIRKKNT